MPFNAASNDPKALQWQLDISPAFLEDGYTNEAGVWNDIVVIFLPKREKSS